MQPIEIQWELSNPQYYPDDSAPPVPNMTVSTIEDNSLAFQSIKDYYALHETLGKYGGQNDLSNFAGIVNSVDFDYESGLLQATVDHLFYNYLNVDATVPPYRIVSQRTHDFYFKELIPASCGLYTIDTPDVGRHVLYLAMSNARTDKFAFSGFGESYSHDVRSSQNARTTLVNHSQENQEDYHVLDFIIDFHSANLTNGVNYMLVCSNYMLEFTINRYDLVFTIYHVVSDGIEGFEHTFTTTHDFDNLDTTKSIYCRLDFSTEQFTSQYTKNDNNIGRTVSGYSEGMPENTKLKINKIVVPDASSGTRLGMQVIGYTYTDVGHLREYDDLPRPKSHYYQIVDYTGPVSLPAHTGNMWSYINMLAATKPFKELI